MMIRQIIRIFLPLAVLTAAPAPLRADLSVGPRVRLRSDLSGRDGEFLRAAIRQLDQLRHLSGVKPPKADLTVSGGAAAFARTPDQLRLPGDARLWERDFALRRRIYGALAAHRFRMPFPPDSGGLASWATAGIDDSIRAAGSMGKYIAGNRTFPLLAEFYARNGRLPDFRALCRLEFPGGAVTEDFAAEQSRLLLEIFARNGRIGDLCADMLEGKEPDCWRIWYASAEAAQRHLTADAQKLLWSRFRPLPPGLAGEKVAELETFFFPEKPEDGSPPGRIISGDIRSLAAQLTPPRADAAALRGALAAPWRELGAMLAPPERDLCTRAAAAVLNAGVRPDAPELFTAAVTALKATLLRRREQERFLEAALDRALAPAVRLKLPLRGAENNNPALLPAEAEFFSRTLDRYLR